MRRRRLERLEDAELLALSQQSSDARDAFGVFYARYEADVVAYLRRRLPHAELAADLTAETFASALEASGRFSVEHSRDGRALGWLLTIAHRKLLTSITRGKVADETRRRLQMTQPLELEDQALERVDELASVPEQLDELLGALPAVQRQAVLARVVDEQPYAQIAEQMACSELVVRQRVSRALATLRRQLPQEAL